MFGREDLIWEWSDELDAGFKIYDVEKVNEIMDRMEARIKQLEKENEDIDRMKTRIKELETKLAKEKAYSHSLREELSNYNELYKHYRINI